MYKFAAIYTPPHSTRQDPLKHKILDMITRNGTAASLRFDNHGLKVWEWDDKKCHMTSHFLKNHKGIVLGHLFHPKPNGTDRTQSRTAPIHLDNYITTKIVESNGLYLCENYWGNYVALLLGNGGNSISIFRSPQGRLPCFVYEQPDFYFIFSDPSFMREIDRSAFSIDWNVAAAYVKQPIICHHKTAIKNVIHLNPAQHISIAKSAFCLSYIWLPLPYMERPSMVNIHKAHDVLRNVVLDTIDTYARHYQKIGITLSGGFDSSLLVGLLSKFKTKEEMVPLTFFNESPLVDERLYARITCHHLGLTLNEIQLTGDRVDASDYGRLNSSPMPYNSQYDQERIPLLRKYANLHEFSVLFGGTGGDEVFGAYGNNLALLDHIYYNGFRKDFLSIAMRSAWTSNTSLIKTLKEGLGYYFKMRTSITENYFDNPEHCWGLSTALLADPVDKIMAPPWENYMKDCPPGKLATLMPVMLQGYWFSSLKDIEPIPSFDPFISQPIVEVSLSIPTYIHQYNGVERGLARVAFQDIITPEAKRRRFKSHFTPYVYDIIKPRIEKYTRFLLDGILMEKGYLNKSDIEALRREPQSGSTAQYSRLADLVAVEAWARSWS